MPVSTCDDYFDTLTLDWRRLEAVPLRCPVRDCSSPLTTAPSQWGEMPFCSILGLRIHPADKKFVFYNGATRELRRRGAMRNIRSQREFFATHIYGSIYKAETHRFAFETSEDALTWNVFTEVAAAGALGRVLQHLSAEPLCVPELYLWGLKIDPASPNPAPFHALEAARRVFEPDITRFRTEPDIMLYVPGRVLLVCEAKFTSGNKLSREVDPKEGEKPEGVADILKRYSLDKLPPGVLRTGVPGHPFYSQLYRELVFTVHMAAHLGVEWRLVSLVSSTQFEHLGDAPEYADPSAVVRSWLEPGYASRFYFRTWENIYREVIAGDESLSATNDYLRHKSARMEAAFRT